MLPEISSALIETLLIKLAYFADLDEETVDLIDVISCLTSDLYDKIPYFPVFSNFEKRLLKQALPHCIRRAAMQQEFKTKYRNEDGCHELDESKNVNDGSVMIHSSQDYSAPKEAGYSLISSGSNDRNLPMTAKPINHPFDVFPLHKLFVTLSELRHVLMLLPRWSPLVSSNTGSSSTILDENTPKENPCTTCHEKCKLSEKRHPATSKSLNPLSQERLRRRSSFLQMSSGVCGRPKDDPLALLRTYCKHFHVGGSVRDYEKLVEDFKECTFQPNMHKYRNGLRQSTSCAVDDSYKKGNINPFHTFFNKGMNNANSSYNKSPSEATSASPKYCGVASRFHIECLKNSCGCSRKNSNIIRRQRWEDTLRKTENVSTCCHSHHEKAPKLPMDPQKAKRYYDYDWGRYIRLQDRNLKAVCVQDNTLYNSLLEESSSYQAIYTPEPTLVEWCGGDGSNEAVFCAKTPVKEHQVNWLRNMSSLIRYEVKNKTLTCPLRVSAVPSDPVTELERRLQEAKPIDYSQVVQLSS